MLHQLFGTDSKKTYVSLLILLTHLFKFTYSPLALSATFHSRLKAEHFKLSYPDSTPAQPHIRHHHRLLL